MTALVLAAILFAALIGPQRDDLVIAELHHGYYGIAACALGWAFHWPVVYWLGVVVLADDAMQHAFQRWLFGPSYRSPLHQLYGYAYRIPVVRRLNEWLER